MDSHFAICTVLIRLFQQDVFQQDANVCNGSDFSATVRRYDASTDTKTLHTSSNHPFYLATNAIQCVMVAANCLLTYSRQQRNSLLSLIFSKYDEPRDDTLTNAPWSTRFHTLCNIQCHSFLSMSYIDPSAGRSILHSFGLNIYCLRRELERRYSGLICNQFEFQHILDFMAISLINEHFIPPPDPNVDLTCEYDMDSDELDEYNSLNITEQTTYVYIGITFLQHIVGKGYELQVNLQQSAAG